MLGTAPGSEIAPGAVRVYQPPCSIAGGAGGGDGGRVAAESGADHTVPLFPLLRALGRVVSVQQQLSAAGAPPLLGV